MNTNERCSQLLSACAGGMSALRTVVHHVPAGGDGDKVSPPTHEGGQYAFEKRVVDGRTDVQTVLLDSVQSQANRFEAALLKCRMGGRYRDSASASGPSGTRKADVVECSTSWLTFLSPAR
jgi:hypothetical protein